MTTRHWLLATALLCALIVVLLLREHPTRSVARSDERAPRVETTKSMAKVERRSPPQPVRERKRQNVSTSHRPPEGDSPLRSDDVAELRERLETLRGQLASLRSELNRQAGVLQRLQSERVEVEPSHADLDALQDREEYVIVSEESRVLEYHQQLAAVFDLEHRDIAWAGETIRWLDGVVDDIATGALNLIDIDCRSSLCRIEVEYETRAAQADFETLLATLTVEHLPSMTVDTAVLQDGSISSIFYLGRSGYGLPG